MGLSSFAHIVVLSGAMFVGSMVSGLLPFMLNLSPQHLKHVTGLGMGMLIGTAFAVIIPEGIHTVYGSQTFEHEHESGVSPFPSIPEGSNVEEWSVAGLADDASRVQGVEGAGFNFQDLFAQSEGASEEDNVGSSQGTGRRLLEGERTTWEQMINEYKRADAAMMGGEMPNEGKLSVPPAAMHETAPEIHAHTHTQHTAEAAHDIKSGHGFEAGTSHGSAGHSHSHGGGSQSTGDVGACPEPWHPPNSSKFIGLALVLGFIFQLFADHIGDAHLGHGHSHGGSAHAEHHGHADVELVGAAQGESKKSKTSLADKQSFKATFGILVHSAVDGIALGAISVTDNDALEFVVFLAIMLHKAPAGFGLSSFLIKQRVSKASIHKQILAFSATAPITAIISFLVLGGDGQSIFEQDPSLLGLCLLFSGGTFIYTIAVHILPSLNSAGDSNFLDTVFVCMGILLPVWLSLIGGHAH
jgi:zinc transporter 9